MSVYFRCGPHLRSDDSAPMHFLEVAVRLVSMLFRPAAGLLDLPQNVIRLVYRRIKRPVSCLGHCGAPVFSTSCREGESTAEVSFRRHSPAPSPLAPGLHCATTPSVPFTRIFGHDRATGSAAAAATATPRRANDRAGRDTRQRSRPHAPLAGRACAYAETGGQNAPAD